MASDRESAVQLYQRSRDTPKQIPVNELEVFLESEEDDIVHPAMMALSNVAGEDPEAVLPLLDSVQELLHVESVTSNRLAVHVLNQIAPSHPYQASQLTDDLVELLGEQTTQMDGWDLFSASDEIPQESLQMLPRLIHTLMVIEDSHSGATLDAVEYFQRLLHVPNDTVQLTVVRMLATISLNYPGEVRPVAEELRNKLEYQVQADDQEIRAWLGQGGDEMAVDIQNAATTALARTAIEYPSVVQPSIEQLIERLNAEEGYIRQETALALYCAARECPEDVRPAIESLKPHLDDPHKGARSQTALALAELADEYPQEIVPCIDTFASLLEDNARTNAAWALNVLAKHNPRDVSRVADCLVGCLHADTELLRENAISALQRIGSECPDTIESLEDDLLRRLTDSSAEVRETAAELLVQVATRKANQFENYLKKRESF